MSRDDKSHSSKVPHRNKRPHCTRFIVYQLFYSNNFRDDTLANKSTQW